MMLYKLSNHIVENVLKRELIVNDQAENLRFGLEVILSQLLTFMPMIIYSLITSSYIKSALFLFTFITLRTIKKGFHAKSFLTCFALSNLTFLFCINSELIIKTYQKKYVILIFILYCLYCTINFIADKHNQQIKNNFMLVVLLSIAGVLLIEFGYINLSLVLSSVLLIDMTTYFYFIRKSKIQIS